MDGSLYGILYYAVPAAALGVLYGILHVEARRRGGSIWKDVGPNGWFVALLIAWAASSFAAAVLNGLQVVSSPTPDWFLFLIETPVLVGLGLLLFFGGRNEYFYGSLRAPGAMPSPSYLDDRPW